MGLCPGTKITGGKVMSGKTRPTANRAAQALRLAAAALRTSQSALGAYYRRLCARMDKAKAVTAAAHKLARLVYSLLSKGQEYTDQVRPPTRSDTASVCCTTCSARRSGSAWRSFRSRLTQPPSRKLRLHQSLGRSFLRGVIALAPRTGGALDPFWASWRRKSTGTTIGLLGCPSFGHQRSSFPDDPAALICLWRSL